MTVVHSGGTVVRAGPVDDSAPPRRDREPVSLGVAQMLQVLALLVVWVFVYLGLLSGFEHGHAQRALYDEVRTQLALGEVPAGAPIAPGTPLGVLSIPGVGLRNEVFVEGTRNEQLQDGPGHVYGTVMPGQRGVSELAGRSTTFGAPFRDVYRLRPGAVVAVTTANGSFEYRVTGVRTKGDPVPAPPEGTAARLTLVTSLPRSGLLGALRPADTVYVDARLAKGAVAPGAVGTSDPDVTYMSTSLDTATLAQVAIALQLLGLVLAGCVWGWLRWSRAAVWLVGTPAVLASLWIASSLLSQCIPGLF